MQFLSSVELGALITAIHRTTQMNLPIVLAGARLPQLLGLAGDAESYAERLFEFTNIGSLTHDDAAAALLIPVHELDVDDEPAAVDLIIEASRGYPYFLQEWGYHVWNLAERSPITTADVETVHPSFIAHRDRNFFQVRTGRLTPKEKAYLTAMARLGHGPHRSGDIAAELGVRVESVAPRRSALIGTGMIYSPAHGDTACSVPLFDDFLLRAAAIGEV